MLLGVSALVVGQECAASALINAPSFDGAAACPRPPPGATEHWIEHDGARLAVWRIPGRVPAKTVLVLHGVRDQRSSMLGVARGFQDAGYEVLLVDLRGHGCSSGRYLTYGVRDSGDLVAVLDALASRASVGVYGPSYGGAAALQLAARERRVHSVVTVSTFSSLRAVVPDYAHRYMGPIATIVPAWFLARVYRDAEARAHFRIDEADTARIAQRSHARILLLHGDADEHIPVAHARRLHRALPASELVVLRGMNHDTIMGSPRTLELARAFMQRTL